MNDWDSTIDRVALVALVVLSAALVYIVTALPALPVDETRYLTVAWEMRSTGSWALPTLNFAPYSHKPPLLFWLINASWTLFGVSVWPARLVGALAMAAAIGLTHALDRRLAPSPERGPADSVLILLALPLFVTLGLSIMFDMLLTATVAGSMLALWICGRTGNRMAFAGFGLGVGLGLLAKGPIVLLFTLPAALLAPFWIDPTQRRGWSWRIALSLGLAVAMALAWALRAAYLGGPEYAEMLFWKQSAGRIASSFAHARPFWFYVPILLLFLIPLLLWRPAWTGLRAVAGTAGSARNFLLSWILPALLGLSLISGKQIHYLLPLLPALALLLSLGMRNAGMRPRDGVPLLVFSGLLFAGLIALAAGVDRWLPEGGTLELAATMLSIPLLALTGAAVMGILAAYRSTPRRTLTAIAIANLIFVAAVFAQSRQTITELFDLQPVADVIATKNGPVATAQRTHGEYGFLARLKQPVVFVPEKNLACWLAQNPQGVAVVRGIIGKPETSPKPDAAKILYERPFRRNERVTVLAAAAGTQVSPACATGLTRVAPAEAVVE